MGELKQVVTPTKTIEYKHNANNQRVAKLVNGIVVEKYLWADLTTLLAIYDGNDNLLQRFEYADSRMPISYTQGSNKYYLHYDQVGSLKAVTDNNHNIIKEIAYDSFGNILSDSNPNIKVPFAFAGGLYDEDTKLLRFGYRDYDSYTGKWTAKDPIDFDGDGFNLYGYVLNDPVNFVDSNGLWIAQAIGATIGFGFELSQQIQTGRYNMWNLAVATGTGALGGFGKTALKSLLFGTSANALNTFNKTSNYDEIVESIASGFIGSLAGTLGRNIGLNVGKGVIGSYLGQKNNYENIGTAIGSSIGSVISNTDW